MWQWGTVSTSAVRDNLIGEVVDGAEGCHEWEGDCSQSTCTLRCHGPDYGVKDR